MLEEAVRSFKLKINYDTGNNKQSWIKSTYHDEQLSARLKVIMAEGVSYGNNMGFRGTITWIPPHRIINIEVTYVEKDSTWTDV